MAALQRSAGVNFGVIFAVGVLQVRQVCFLLFIGFAAKLLT